MPSAVDDAVALLVSFIAIVCVTRWAWRSSPKVASPEVASMLMLTLDYSSLASHSTAPCPVCGAEVVWLLTDRLFLSDRSWRLTNSLAALEARTVSHMRSWSECRGGVARFG